MAPKHSRHVGLAHDFADVVKKVRETLETMLMIQCSGFTLYLVLQHTFLSPDQTRTQAPFTVVVPSRPLRITQVVTDYTKDRRLCFTLALGISSLAAYTAYQTSQPKVG